MSHNNLDQSITESVVETVELHNQPSDLSHKILSWLDAVHSGQESLEDKNAYLTRIDVLISSVRTKSHGK